MASVTKPPQTVSYWAISILSSRTTWAGLGAVVIGVLSMPEVLALIPLRYLPVILALSGALSIWLRKLTVRPVALILPAILGGEGVKAVEVPKIGPPPLPGAAD